MTNDEHEFQKKLAIYQIAATAGATLGSILVALGISLIVFSSGLSLEAVGLKALRPRNQNLLFW